MSTGPYSAHRALACCLLPLAVACGGGGALRLGDVTPEAIPSLEAQRAQRPGDATALTRLGVAYFRASRLDEARSTLDSVAQRDPQNGIAAIYLGMTAEAQGDFAAARGAYERYVAIGRSTELKRTARQRLALIGRRQLEHEARQALAQEAAVSQLPPEANTIAVMPFAYTGTNEEIRPLTRGFAQLVVTDLAKSGRLRVLERERMQAMVDEMQLTEEGRSELQSAARSGRLLRAERVVQGSLAERGADLRVDAAVVDVGSAGVAASSNASDQLNRLFDLEKAIVLDIFSDLGIQLTDAERAAIQQRPTQNLQAFLAWSRGLVAEDQGDFAGARDLFFQAQRLDPSFSAAAQSAGQAADLSAAASQSVHDVDVTVAQSAGTETGAVSQQQLSQQLQTATNTVAPSALSQVTETQQSPTTVPTDRDPTPEATRTEGPKPVSGTVTIVIRRP